MSALCDLKENPHSPDTFTSASGTGSQNHLQRLSGRAGVKASPYRILGHCSFGVDLARLPALRTADPGVWVTRFFLFDGTGFREYRKSASPKQRPRFDTN
jgi:hypothetical protein